ncbi:MAG TPA: ABC transporter permease subunit [Prolixibacteraceae bacterium]|nr:ABC transporter permease subunit [Prolixibacteraceae bacterium]
MKHILLFAALLLIAFLPGCSEKETGYTGLEMLEGGKTFAVPTGSAADQLVLKRFPEARLKYFNTTIDCVLSVRDGKADAAAYDITVIQNIAAKLGGLTVIDEYIVDDQYGFAVQKENIELKNTIDSVVVELKRNGTYDDMVRRWLPAKGSPAPMPPIDESGENGILRLITSAVAEPMSFHDSSMNIVGFDIELAYYVARKLGKKLEIIDLEFGAMLPALVSGKGDMVGASLSITEERAKSVLFSDAYFYGGLAAVVRSNAHLSPPKQDEKLKTIDDIRDKRIGVLLGSIYDSYVTEHYPEASIFQYQNASDQLAALNGGKIDVMFIDDIAVDEIIKTNDKVVRFAENIYYTDIAAGFNQNDDTLREQFNHFLAEIRSDGIYDDMVRRWIDQEWSDMPVIEGSDENGELRVGVMSDSGMPFTGIVNGELTGFDIELSKRFAAWSGKKFVPVDLPFSSMIASISSGKIDAIVCCIMITEERKKQIDFSDPYYNSGATVIALRENVSLLPRKKMAILNDIADKKVGIFAGTIHYEYLKENFPKAEIFIYDFTADMILSLKTGKIDATMLGTITAGLVLKSNPDLAILDDSVFTMPLGVGFRKDSPKLRAEFNRFLKEIRSNGLYDEMVQRWFINDAEEAVMPRFGHKGTGEKLTVAVSVEDLPYVAWMNNEFVGFDVEMIQRFADWGNYKLEIIEINFPSLIAALNSGKVDMISDGIAINEERKMEIDFSDPYTHYQTAVVVAKKNLSGAMKEEQSVQKKTFIQAVSQSFYNNILREKRYLLILNGLYITVIISILSALMGTLIGALVCWMRMAKNHLLSYTARLLINLIRGTPVLVLLMIIFYVIFASVNISPVLVAVIAFGINFGAYVSEMFRTSIESIDKGQREAGIAGGFSTFQTFMHIIMPQALRRVLPVYKGEFISLLKMTSIVGYIAVQDLTKASDIIRSRTFDAFFPLIMAAVIYIILAWLLTLALNSIEVSVDPKRRKLKKAEEVAL